MPTYIIGEKDLKDGKTDILAILTGSGLCSSRGDARRNVEQGGVTVSDERITDPKKEYTADELSGEGIIVKRGKKNFVKVCYK